MPRDPLGNPDPINPSKKNKKNHSVLYLINMNRSGRVLSQIHQQCTTFDSLQTYTSADKMREMAKKADEVFDYVVVVGANHDGE